MRMPGACVNPFVTIPWRYRSCSDVRNAAATAMGARIHAKWSLRTPNAASSSRRSVVGACGILAQSACSAVAGPKRSCANTTPSTGQVTLANACSRSHGAPAARWRLLRPTRASRRSGCALRSPQSRAAARAARLAHVPAMAGTGTPTAAHNAAVTESCASTAIRWRPATGAPHCPDATRHGSRPVAHPGCGRPAAAAAAVTAQRQWPGWPADHVQAGCETPNRGDAMHARCCCRCHAIRARRPQCRARPMPARMARSAGPPRPMQVTTTGWRSAAQARSAAAASRAHPPRWPCVRR